MSHGCSRSPISLHVPKLMFSVSVFKGIYSKTWKVVFYCNFGSPLVMIEK